MKEKCKKEKKERSAIVFFSLLTEEIVELSYELSLSLKRCYSIALGILKIVNILKVLQTPHSKIRSISIIPYFKLLNILGFIRNGKTK